MENKQNNIKQFIYYKLYDTEKSLTQQQRYISIKILYLITKNLCIKEIL